MSDVVINEKEIIQSKNQDPDLNAAYSFKRGEADDISVKSVMAYASHEVLKMIKGQTDANYSQARTDSPALKLEYDKVLDPVRLASTSAREIVPELGRLKASIVSAAERGIKAIRTAVTEGTYTPSFRRTVIANAMRNVTKSMPDKIKDAMFPKVWHETRDFLEGRSANVNPRAVKAYVKHIVGQNLKAADAEKLIKNDPVFKADLSQTDAAFIDIGGRVLNDALAAVKEYQDRYSELSRQGAVYDETEKALGAEAMNAATVSIVNQNTLERKAERSPLEIDTAAYEAGLKAQKTAAVDSGKVFVELGREDVAERQMIKSSFGARWDKDNKVWAVDKEKIRSSALSSSLSALKIYKDPQKTEKLEGREKAELLKTTQKEIKERKASVTAAKSRSR